MTSNQDDIILHTHAEDPSSYAGLESDKEVIVQQGLHSIRQPGERQENKVFVRTNRSDDGLHTYNSESASEPASRSPKRGNTKKVLGLRRRYICIIALLLIIIVTAVVPPLVVLMKSSKNPEAAVGTEDTGEGSSHSASSDIAEPTSTVPPGPQPVFTSKSVIERSGLDMSKHNKTLILIFQAGNGRAQSVSRELQGEWKNPTNLGLPFDKIKAGTPLASYPEETDENIIWHLIFVDITNTAQHYYKITSDWNDGKLGITNFEVSDTLSSVFTIAWHPTSLNGGDFNTIHLYATDSEGMVREQLTDGNTQVWRAGDTDLQGISGLGGAHAGYQDGCIYMVACADDSRGLAFYYRYNPVPNDESAGWIGAPSNPSGDFALQNSAVCTVGFVVFFQNSIGAVVAIENFGNLPSSFRWTANSVQVSESGEEVMNGTNIACYKTEPGTNQMPSVAVVYQRQDGSLVEAWAEYNGTLDNIMVWRHRVVVEQAEAKP